jgi:hypothetical protein
MARLVSLVLALVAGGTLGAQTPGPHNILGDWEAKTDGGLRHILVRRDSSAQFGDQVARWRLVGDSLWITLGDGVWEVYGLKVRGEELTIAGGDLKKPVTLHRVGPAPARPDTLAIPASPPDTARAWD